MHETIHTVVFKLGEGGGNPCPVTLNADDLTPEEMQKMTAGFGEESAFLLQPSGPGFDIRPRYFVPLHEMEMCVHATIGSATVLVEKNIFQKSPIIFETMFGPVEVTWERKDGRINVGVTQFPPRFKEKNPAPEETAAALRISTADLKAFPIVSAATSRFKLMVPLVSKDVLYHLEPDFEQLWNLCDHYDTTGFYPFAIEEEKDGPVIYARQFPKRAGYPEDPATGVAASALSAYLVQYHVMPVREGWNCFTIRQGEAMGRPSVIGADCLVEEGKIIKTRVCGNAEIVG
ncbi:MAG: PhzF family phenazine biosynthesis isomerase [Stomatobaculum sp.]|nr:PhzF family phenazine biosynthesis isomerase [Stomatobaculum sp.]